jgi:hypothetical protein
MTNHTRRRGSVIKNSDNQMTHRSFLRHTQAEEISSKLFEQRSELMKSAYARRKDRLAVRRFSWEKDT